MAHYLIRTIRPNIVTDEDEAPMHHRWVVAPNRAAALEIWRRVEEGAADRMGWAWEWTDAGNAILIENERGDYVVFRGIRQVEKRVDDQALIRQMWEYLPVAID